MWPYMVWMLLVVSWLIFRGKGEIPTRGGRTRLAAEIRGAQGESDVAAVLHSLLNEMCGNDFVLRHSVILNIAPGTKYPTAEIDHLAITPFGIFVIETKAWRGQIAPGHSDDSLLWISPAGVTELRKSPLAQNRSKVTFIRNLIPDDLLAVVNVGVFSSRHARFSPNMPLNIIGIGDIRHWFCLQLQSWRGMTTNFALPKFVDVAKLDRTIMKFADTSPGAASRHKERIITD